MEKQFKLIYALKDDAIVSISDVERGLECGCICPGCGDPLIAKKGPKKMHHFAHKVGTNCEHGYESSLHLAAKDILSKANKMVIPPAYVHFPDSYKKDELICEAKEIEIEKVELEQRFGDIIPDIVVYANGTFFFVEIFVTHCIDENKLQKLREAKISTIEIDLSKKNTTISVEELTDLLLKDSPEKRWKYNRLSDKYLDKFIAVSSKKDIVTRGLAMHIDACPMKMRIWEDKPYANFMDDCLYCEFCISTKDGLLCSGDEAISTVNDFSVAKDERKRLANAKILRQKEIISSFFYSPHVNESVKTKIEREISAGFEEVKNRNFEEDTPIFDSYGKRWFKCKFCEKIISEKENQSVDNRRNVNRGMCRACSRTPR